MQIKVNGEILNDFSGNVTELLTKMSLSADRVAVEYNGDILLRENFKTTILKNNDVVEIVAFVGGG